MAETINQYDENGREHGPWKEGPLHGAFTKISVYDHGRLHGPYEYLYGVETLLKGYYRYDKKHGPWLITW